MQFQEYSLGPEALGPHHFQAKTDFLLLCNMCLVFTRRINLARRLHRAVGWGQEKRGEELKVFSLSVQWTLSSYYPHLTGLVRTSKKLVRNNISFKNCALPEKEEEENHLTGLDWGQWHWHSQEAQGGIHIITKNQINCISLSLYICTRFFFAQ